MNNRQRANRKRWVKALRSGDYAQGRSCLVYTRGRGKVTDPDEFCCLGVAAELSPNAERAEPQEGFVFRQASVEGSGMMDVYNSMPPVKFMESEFGMTHIQMDSLAEQNDKGRSFKQIAASIERMS